MNDKVYQRFADSLLSVSPLILLEADEISKTVIAQGLGRFVQNTGGHAAEIVEIAELLARMESGGG